MAGNNFDDEDEITGINVTPLVDVMLVLLVVFMVTATYIVHKSININLPKAASADSSLSTKSLAFAIDRAGTLYLDGKELAFTEIKDTIAKIRDNNKGLAHLQALITADAKTTHGTVVRLIDAVRINGINDFAINVEVDYSQDKTKPPANENDVE